MSLSLWMTPVYASLAALAAAGVASAQITAAKVPLAAARAPLTALSAPAMAAPSLPEAAPAPSLAAAPSTAGLRVLGVPGPGVTPAHIEAVKTLAARTGETIVVHGSRQTGVSRHTGLPFAADADIDLGVVGAAEKLLVFEPDMWDGKIPHARHEPMLAVPTVEDAVGRGHLVVAPALPAPAGKLGALLRGARPWRTDEQLTKLAQTPRGPAETFRFAVIGDAEPGRFWFSRRLFNRPGVFLRQLARADASRPDFIFQLGDMVSRGTIGRFRTFFLDLVRSEVITPYLTALGNHDRHRPHGVSNDRMYRAAFGNPNYSFTRGGMRFVVVDSSAGRITEAQLKWLAGELDPAVPTVVFTHIPPAPLSEWTDWGPLKGAGGFSEGSEAFMKLMSANKVQRVYMGHIHGLGVLERGGVKYVLTGGGGSPLFPGPVKRRLHHWLSVEAGPAGLVETVHGDGGESFPLL